MICNCHDKSKICHLTYVISEFWVLSKYLPSVNSGFYPSISQGLEAGSVHLAFKGERVDEAQSAAGKPKMPIFLVLLLHKVIISKLKISKFQKI